MQIVVRARLLVIFYLLSIEIMPKHCLEIIVYRHALSISIFYSSFFEELFRKLLVSNLFFSKSSASLIVAGSSMCLVSGTKNAKIAAKMLGTPSINIGRGFQ